MDTVHFYGSTGPRTSGELNELTGAVRHQKREIYILIGITIYIIHKNRGGGSRGIPANCLQRLFSSYQGSH